MPNYVFPSFSLEELQERARSFFRAKFQKADVGTGSDYDFTSRLIGTVAKGFQDQAKFILRQLIPQESRLNYVKTYANERGLVAGASYAQGFVVVYGTAGSLEMSYAVLTSTDGLEYELLEDVTIPAALLTGTLQYGSNRSRWLLATASGSFAVRDVVKYSTGDQEEAYTDSLSSGFSPNYLHFFRKLIREPVAGEAITQVYAQVIAIRARKTGAAYNRVFGETLTFNSPMAGITPQAKVIRLEGGKDVESEADLQEALRRNTTKRIPAMTLEEIRKICKNTPYANVGDVAIFPGKDGLGTWTIYVLGKPGARYVTGADVTRVSNWLTEHYKSPEQFTVTGATKKSPISLDIVVESLDSHKPDWKLPPNKTAILTLAGSTTTRINLDGDYRNQIEVGDRVVISNILTGYSYPVQTKVTAITATYIDVEALTVAPATGAKVLPGSALFSVVDQELRAYIDSLSVGVETGGVKYYRYPTVDMAPFAINTPKLQQKLSVIPGVGQAKVTYLGSTPALGELLIIEGTSGTLGVSIEFR